MNTSRIDEHAILGNSRAAALCTRAGHIDWLCWPRFDSPALFAALLDPERGGSFGIEPTSPFSTRRAYLEDTNVLETRFEVSGGSATLFDFMSVAAEEDRRRLLMAEHELVRTVRCSRGEIELAVTFDPRPDFGAGASRLVALGPHDLRLSHGQALYSLRSDVPLRLDDRGVARGRLRLRAGEVRHLVLAYDREAPAVLPLLGESCEAARRRSVDFWRRFARRCRYQGPHRDAVVRSVLTLKLLSFAPSGAIVAAPTTSLPERVGGSLNWDYRFCWLRDAALTVRALRELGYEEDALAFVSWLLHSTRLTRPELRVLYDVYGRPPPPERDLGQLSGHRRSRPVRVSNAAASQLQLDVYGEVIDAVSQVAGMGAALDRETQGMLRDFGRFVCEHWREPDQGIWEPRQEPRPHTHSRVLCWVALDRLLQLKRAGRLTGVDEGSLAHEARAIRQEVERRAFSPVLSSYTQTLDGDTLDASLLLLGWYGYVPAGAPRLVATARAIDSRLGAGSGLLYRYEESVTAGEGAFGICSFWMVEHLARAQRLAEAEARLAQLLRFANDLGLYAEEIDPRSGEPLGNFPQAFTHVGLINAALALEQARARRRPDSRAAIPEVRP